jgi:hypothetical protein
MRIDWPLFRLGWRRRSRMIMDTAGAPLWLTRLRCPANGARYLTTITDRLDDPWADLWRYRDEDDPSPPTDS